tara:strand:- start:698 stop:1093 length:396 start_codon:yes stop_codon:yes gene_type:complete
MLRKLSHRDTEDVSINLSPMIDMVFILLIFFIVTTVFVEEIGVTPNNSEPGESSLNEDSIISVEVYESQINVAGEIVSIDNFEGIIRNKARDKEAKFSIICQDGVTHGTYDKVHSIMFKAGLNDRMSTKPF